MPAEQQQEWVEYVREIAEARASIPLTIITRVEKRYQYESTFHHEYAIAHVRNLSTVLLAAFSNLPPGDPQQKQFLDLFKGMYDSRLLP